ncbi:hypothetical protein H671_7g17732 [Cricetulus griseus]|nr:hypothetical protein H671_7g17732 [Cricetulus griseus]
MCDATLIVLGQSGCSGILRPSEKKAILLADDGRTNVLGGKVRSLPMASNPSENVGSMQASVSDQDSMSPVTTPKEHMLLRIGESRTLIFKVIIERSLLDVLILIFGLKCCLV